MLLVDDYRRDGWSHFVAHTETDLRDAAALFGLPDAWLREAGTPRVHYVIPERVRRKLLDTGVTEIGWRELGRLVEMRAAAAAAFPAPAQRRPEPAAPAGPPPVVYVDVPDPAGPLPAPRQRWNPDLQRHAWARLAEHWTVCLHCGVHRWNRPGTGGRWYHQWGYRDWPADRWGSTRDGSPFPRCPGPNRQVPAATAAAAGGVRA